MSQETPMSEPVPSQDTSTLRQRTIRLDPTFFRALSGVWLFTWRSQANWRRLSLSLLGMLSLPVLMFLTVPSLSSWERSHRVQMGNPARYLGTFAGRLDLATLPLQQDQHPQLLRIVTEEFRRIETESAGTRGRESTTERQRRQVEACNERILQRAQAVLDERQLAQLQSYQRKNRVERSPTVTRQRGWDRTTPFYHLLIDLYFFIILPLNCVGTCGALIRDELAANTLSFLTTRPLSRARLMVIKYLSQTAWLQIVLLIQTLFLFAAAGLRQIPALGELVPVFLGAQFLAVWAWAGLGLFLGQVAKNYMALALVYGVIVEMGIGRIPTNINTLSLMFHLKTLLGHNEALQGIYEWPAIGVGGPVGALVLGAAMFATLAALLFTFKEYHHTTEMQK